MITIIPQHNLLVFQEIEERFFLARHQEPDQLVRHRGFFFHQSHPGGNLKAGPKPGNNALWSPKPKARVRFRPASARCELGEGCSMLTSGCPWESDLDASTLPWLCSSTRRGGRGLSGNDVRSLHDSDRFQIRQLFCFSTGRCVLLQ